MSCLRAALFATMVASIVSLIASRAAAGTSCESLATLALPDAHITTAETVAAGKFQPTEPGSGPTTFTRPCRRSAAWRRR